MKLIPFFLILHSLSFAQSREGFNPADFRPTVGLVTSGKALYGAYAGIMYTGLNVYETGIFAEVAHARVSNRAPLALLWKNYFKFSREGVSPFMALNLGGTKGNGMIIEMGGGVKGEGFSFLGTEAKMVISVAYRFAMVPLVNASYESQGVPLMGSGVVVRVGIEL